jgi:mannonate dehydratase
VAYHGAAMSHLHLSRRRFIEGIGAAALAGSAAPAQGSGGVRARRGRATGRDVPMICMGISSRASESDMRRIKQLGVDCVLMGGPAIPWQAPALREVLDRFKAGGLTVCNMMIGGFTDTLYGRPGRDEEIAKVKESIAAAGKAGLPVVEYNFYAHRAMEGYYEVTGRAGAGYTGFDYERMKDLPPLPEEGARTLDEMWANVTYFLKAVIPVAERSGVRLALHPNDPPAPLSRGSAQIMGTVAGWKRLIGIVDSPANGITFDCGVTREVGDDPVAVCRYFGTRDRINHMHYRNVRMHVPRERYEEVFVDEGEVDMFGVMREAVRSGYRFAIYPEHPRALDYDREVARPSGGLRGYPGGGGYAGDVFNVAYTRAMLQAAVSVSRDR